MKTFGNSKYSLVHYTLNTIPDLPTLRANELKDSLCKSFSTLLEEASKLSNNQFTNDLEYDPTSYSSYLKFDKLGTLYGMSSVLRLWEGNNANSKLPYSIAHSFNIWTQEAHPGDARVGYPVVTWQSTSISKFISLYNSIFNSPVVFIPSPLRIIEELRSIYSFSRQDVVIDNKGVSKCLFFLSHSTNHIKGTFNLEEIESIVASLRNTYVEVNCVMYFLDCDKRSVISDYFDNVYSCGHNLDPCFLLRLYALIQSHDAISYNKIGSHAFMASSIDKPVIHFDSHVQLKATSEMLRFDGFSNACYEKFSDKLRPYIGCNVSNILVLNTTYSLALSESLCSLRSLSRNDLLKVYLFYLIPIIQAFKKRLMQFRSAMRL